MGPSALTGFTGELRLRRELSIEKTSNGAIDFGIIS